MLGVSLNSFDPVGFFCSSSPTKILNSKATSFSSCIPIWSCDSWSRCGSDGFQERSCVDMRSCNQIGSLPEIKRSCFVNASRSISNLTSTNSSLRRTLFDIALEPISLASTPFDPFLVKVSLLNFGLDEEVPATISYDVTDSDGITVFYDEEVVAVQTQIDFIKTFDFSYLKSGDYDLAVRLTYAGQKEPATSNMSFTLIGESSFNYWIIIFIALLILVFGISYIVYRRRKLL